MEPQKAKFVALCFMAIVIVTHWVAGVIFVIAGLAVPSWKMLYTGIACWAFSALFYIGSEIGSLAVVVNDKK